ncbi:MAG: hypothetical protein ABI402_03300 [Ferruginibacter sp.]
MKYNHSILLLIFISSLLFQSCAKVTLTDNSSDETYHLSFSRHALDYVNLTEGKYFIYKDSVTSLIDSMIATESKLESTFVPKVKLTFDYTTWDETPAHYYEKYSLTLTKFTGNVQTAWFRAGAETIFRKPYTSSDTIEVELNELSPFSNALFKFSETNGPGISIVIEGKTYNDVFIATTDNGVQDTTSQYYTKDIFYWAKGIGLIKWQTFSGANVAKNYVLLRNN